jgi:type IV secretion system protein VirB5
MFIPRRILMCFLPLFAFAAAPAAHAQWAVIDVNAIVQLTQEVAVLHQQLTTAENELTQAQNTFSAMTGTRGMQNLLSGTVRNYLPSSLSDLQAVLQGTSGTYGALSASVASLVQTNAVLNAQQVAQLSPALQARLAAARNANALLQAIAGSALSTASARFASLQQLITAIGTATDQKGALDLQARINAEQSMLQNDRSKLAVLAQAAEGQRAAAVQAAQEQAIADVGSFRSLPPMGL